MTEEPKKNHWYEMYKLECLKTKELEKENARLKDGIALKDEEVGCIETDFNTFKSKAKGIIVTFLGLMQTFGYSPSMDKFITEAEQFIEE